MEKEHFEILLERIEDSTQLLAEGQAATNERLDRLDGRFDKVDDRLERLEVGQVVTNKRLEVLEVGQAEIKSDVRDIKRSVGLLNSIANDHETRLQGVENKLRDHLGNHS